MLLFLKKDCTFCKGFPDLPGMRKFFYSFSNGLEIVEESETKLRIQAPVALEKLPALIVGREIYYGKSKILEVLEKEKA